MKTKIHVNQHKIRSNRKNEVYEPVLTVKTYKSNTYAHEVVLRHRDSREVIGRVVYQPDKPLSCGATVWIEIDSDIVMAETVNRCPSCNTEHD